MDNDISGELKTSLRKYNLTYELTQPNIHRRNAAECAIRTYKNHLLAGSAPCHPYFPLSEWDRLLDKENLTLNLLRASIINPNLSAHVYLFGNFDFNAHPLAPPGSKVVLHKKTYKRASWEYHGVEAWYVAPTMEHCRCLKCFVPKTGAVSNINTAHIIPHIVPIPEFNDVNAVQQAVSDILHIIKHSPETNIPKFWKGDVIQQAFCNVAEALQRSHTTPTPTIPIPEQQRIKQKTLISQENIPEQTPPCPATPVPIQLSDKITLSLQIPTPIPLSRVQSPPQPTHHFFPPVPVPVVQYHDIPNLPYDALPRVVPRSPFPKIWEPSPTQIWQPHLVANHIFNDRGREMTIDDLIADPQKKTWLKSTSNELGRLAKGITGRVTGTHCVAFIPKSKVPTHKEVTYANMVCDYRPLKSALWRVRLTIGGDKLDYFDETASPAANLLETKLLINSTISNARRGARFLGIDIKGLLPFITSSTGPMRVYADIFKIFRCRVSKIVQYRSHHSTR